MTASTRLTLDEMTSVATISGLLAAIAPWRFPLIRAAVDGKIWTYYFGPDEEIDLSAIVKPGVPLILHTDDRADIGPDNYRGLDAIRRYCRGAIILGIRPALEEEICGAIEAAAEHRLIFTVEADAAAGAWLRALRGHMPCVGMTLNGRGDRVQFATNPGDMETAA